MEEKIKYPQIHESPWGVFAGETEHFAFTIYNSVDKRRYNVVLQAAIWFKTEKRRKFEISSCLFDSRDYKDEETTYIEAKKWLFYEIEQLCKELHMEERGT